MWKPKRGRNNTLPSQFELKKLIKKIQQLNDKVKKLQSTEVMPHKAGSSWVIVWLFFRRCLVVVVVVVVVLVVVVLFALRPTSALQETTRSAKLPSPSPLPSPSLPSPPLVALPWLFLLSPFPLTWGRSSRDRTEEQVSTFGRIRMWVSTLFYSSCCCFCLFF